MRTVEEHRTLKGTVKSDENSRRSERPSLTKGLVKSDENSRRSERPSLTKGTMKSDERKVCRPVSPYCPILISNPLASFEILRITTLTFRSDCAPEGIVWSLLLHASSQTFPAHPNGLWKSGNQIQRCFSNRFTLTLSALSKNGRRVLALLVRTIVCCASLSEGLL